MRYILIKLISFYQLILSPLFPGVCRFHPNCSHYSREAITVHGVMPGLLLTILRLLRCNPLFRAGHDPVPGVLSFSTVLGQPSYPGLARRLRTLKYIFRSQKT